MNKELISRIAGGLCSPLGIVLVILFFLPWLDLRCQSTRLASASGWQLTVGDVSLSKQMEEQASAEPEEEQWEGPDARPVFILGLILPLAMLGVSLGMFTGRLGTTGGAVVAILAVAGIVVMVGATYVDYAEEMQPEPPPEQAEDSDTISLFSEKDEATMEQQMRTMLNTDPRGALWTSLVFYILAAVVGAAAVALPAVMKRLPAFQPGPGEGGGEAGPPPTDAEPTQSESTRPPPPQSGRTQ